MIEIKGIYGNREKEELAVEWAFEKLYGDHDLPITTIDSVLAAWYGEDTELDGQILRASGIKVLDIGALLHEHGFFGGTND